MRQGKLSPIELEEIIFNNIKSRRDEVVVSAKLGADCAVIENLGYTLLTTDPITAECSNAGELAIKVNANDIAASSGEPVACTLTIIAPPTASKEDISKIVIDAEKAAKELNIEIVGGHTEFNDVVNRILVSCTMIGKVSRLPQGMKAGDSIVMTKYACIEGTLILSDMSPEIAKKYYDDIDMMRKSLSVMEESVIAASLNTSKMHDVTEGGIFGAVIEMCGGTYGAVIDVMAIPIKQVTLELAKKYDINPYRTVSSGSMLIATHKPELLVNALMEKGVQATIIGKITADNKIIARYSNHEIELEVIRDEIFNLNKE